MLRCGLWIEISILRGEDIVVSELNRCQSYYARGCEGTPFRSLDGKSFCVLHYPAQGKEEQFREALEQRLSQENYDFRDVWFPEEVNFEGFHFDAAVNFSNATFQTSVNLRRAIFRHPVIAIQTQFHGIVDLSQAEFEQGIVLNAVTIDESAWAAFDGAIFSGSKAGFYDTDFGGGVSFNGAKFNVDADFREPKGGRFNFQNAEFLTELKVYSSGRRALRSVSQLNLWACVVRHPEQVEFRGLELKPEWFLEVDCTNFRFFNIDWVYPDLRRGAEYLQSLDRHGPPYHRLSSTYRCLSLNAEQNQRYDEASMFRYAALDALRRASWRGFAPWQVKWWYWAVSGFGERVGRALLILALIWIGFAVIYVAVPTVGFMRWESKPASEIEAARSIPDEAGTPLTWPRTLTYSLEVMALQKPSPQPASPIARIAVALEAVLGPVQAALLALAIRRKVSR
jgi:hypothetical protein